MTTKTRIATLLPLPSPHPALPKFAQGGPAQGDKKEARTPQKVKPFLSVNFADFSLLSMLLIALPLFSTACGRGENQEEGGASKNEESQGGRRGRGKGKRRGGEGAQNKGEGSEEEVEAPPIPVEVIALRRGPLEERIGGLTTLAAKRRATVRAFTGGLLRELSVEEGDSVREGQRLAILDRPGWREQVAAAAASAERSKKEAARLERLAKRGLSPREEAERARFEARQRELELQRLRREGRAAELKSPLEGLVAERLVQPGEVVSAGAALFELMDPRILEASLRLPSEWLPRLDEALPVRLSARRSGAIPATVRLSRIAPIVDLRSGTVKVVLEISEAPRWLRPGVSLRAELTVARNEAALKLPVGALLHDGERPAVMVVREEKAQRVELNLGLEGLREVEVLGPLKEGDQVITFGHRGLPEGAKVLARLKSPMGTARERQGEGR